MRINERVGSVRVRLASWSEMYGVSGEYADVLGEYKTDDILIVHTMGAIDMGNGAATGSLYVPNAVAEGAAAFGGRPGEGNALSLYASCLPAPALSTNQSGL